MNPSGVSYTDSFVIIFAAICAITIAYGSYTVTFGANNLRTNPMNRRSNPGTATDFDDRTREFDERTRDPANDPELTGCRIPIPISKIFQSLTVRNFVPTRKGELISRKAGGGARRYSPNDPEPGLTAAAISVIIPISIESRGPPWASGAGIPTSRSKGCGSQGHGPFGSGGHSVQRASSIRGPARFRGERAWRLWSKSCRSHR